MTRHIVYFITYLSQTALPQSSLERADPESHWWPDRKKGRREMISYICMVWTQLIKEEIMVEQAAYIGVFIANSFEIEDVINSSFQIRRCRPGAFYFWYILLWQTSPISASTNTGSDVRERKKEGLVMMEEVWSPLPVYFHPETLMLHDRTSQASRPMAGWEESKLLHLEASPRHP